MDFGKIKLIIWDLDETLWEGTLSEGSIEIPDCNKKLICNLTDCGVVCSICSKNDYDKVKRVLTEVGLWDLFVFPSINWDTKGPRVKQIIDDMHLRPQNVLFIDDNATNRAEAEFTANSIMTSDVDIIPSLCDYYEKCEKKDAHHKRLEQYKILEKKRENVQATGDVYEFLRQSHIKVRIGYDWFNHIDRIVDLVARSNQLNFTKLRSSREELEMLLADADCKAGYVNVKDDYGDYGLVGFFAIKNNKAIHFTFSCRTLGMGIEQYVWSTLGKPEVQVVGEVVSSLNSPNVSWINLEESGGETVLKEKHRLSDKIVVHGPCDVSSIFGFINDSPNIITEFNYVNEKGISIEQRNCTTHIVESISFDEELRNADTVRKLPFYDKNMFDTAIFDKDTAYVVLSLFTDPCLACYREKSTGLVVCFGDAVYDLTDESRVDEYITESRKLHNCVFTAEDLEHIRNSFAYLGRIQPIEIVSNIDYIYNHLAEQCKLILTLQSETPFQTTNQNYTFHGTRPLKLDNTPRHIYNKNLNDLLREWAIDKPDVYFLDFNRYITGPESFNDHISHFKREVYYKMSCDLVNIIRADGSVKIGNQSRLTVTLNGMKKMIICHYKGIQWRLARIKNAILRSKGHS